MRRGSGPRTPGAQPDAPLQHPRRRSSPARADTQDATEEEEERVLTIVYWQAPSLPGPYLADGYKDRDAGAITLEPLASYDPDGELTPRLASEIPTLENGGVSQDLRSITWRLRAGLRWSDGSDLTADDVVFTWRYCTDEETGCSGKDAFSGITSVRALDDLTVRIDFDAPAPYPYNAFVGADTPIISKAQFADCTGAAARGCDAQNTAPLGSGAYRIIEFVANERAVYERNPFYRGPEPYFDRVVLAGGGDAESAARAVLETGEADYAWNLQIDPQALAIMEESGRGKVVSAFASDVERIVVNQTNPDPALGEDRSEYLDGANPHPFLTFTPIPWAMSMAIDRTRIAEDLYGFAGRPACDLVVAPPRYASTANRGCLAQDIEGANKLLDDSGVLDTDGDGIREYDGTALRITYQTTVNAVRQKTQDLIRDWWLDIRHRGRAGPARGQRVLRRRPGGRRRGDVPTVLRGRADVHDRSRHRSPAVPVRTRVRAHTGAQQQLGRRKQLARLQRNVRRGRGPARPDPNRPGTRRSGKDAERHPGPELLRDPAGDQGPCLGALDRSAGRPHERLGQRAVEHRRVAAIGAGVPKRTR